MQCEQKLKSGGDGGYRGFRGSLKPLSSCVLIYVQSTLLQYQNFHAQTPGFYGAPGQVAGSIILSRHHDYLLVMDPW